MAIKQGRAQTALNITYSASTSPSKTMYFLSGLSDGLLISLNMLDNKPSVQSRVTGSRIPYSSMTVHALGFITYSLVGNFNLRTKRTNNYVACAEESSARHMLPHKRINNTNSYTWREKSNLLSTVMQKRTGSHVVETNRKKR